MFSRKLVGSFGAGIAALGIAAAAGPAEAATFPVNNADGSGPGSLRSAILAAEDTRRRDTIVFEIPGEEVHTIELGSDLPVITKPLTIDGYTQRGAVPATEDAPAAPKIVIDATNVARGLDLAGDGIEIRGLVVENAQEDGIHIEGHENVIAGNHIGTTAAGNALRENGRYGVSLSGSGHVVGGPDPEDGNLISGNHEGEVAVSDGSDHVIEGNRIGTKAAGKAGLGGARGVLLESSGNTVRDNQIGAEHTAVLVEDDDNVLQGNDIGVKASGKRALANSFGIRIVGGDDNLIGGTAEGEGNLVSGNRFEAIRIEPGTDDATGNAIQGNLIGTTFTGRAPLPNGDTVFLSPAVSIVNASGNTVGGTQPGAGNVISGNAGDGVLISADGDDNRVLGNWIGTNKTARRDLGNGGSGVRIIDGDNNRVGDEDEASPLNRIMHNDEDGVELVSGNGNAVLRNSMTDNRNLAIDLGADGSTANDPNDLDTGANDLQNGPEIEEATTTEVEWELETTPNASFRLEFYACDRPGAGEGLTYLGSTTAFTDANGNADETTALPTPVQTGDSVGMTATQTVFGGIFPNLVLVPRGTSELSPCEQVG